MFLKVFMLIVLAFLLLVFIGISAENYSKYNDIVKSHANAKVDFFEIIKYLDCDRVSVVKAKKGYCFRVDSKITLKLGYFGRIAFNLYYHYIQRKKEKEVTKECLKSLKED